MVLREQAVSSPTPPAMTEAMVGHLADLSNEALVELVARSDEAALAELYDRFGRTAFSLALRILRDHALAEDATQDAFLSVWRDASRYVRWRSKAGTWILMVVRHRAIDLVRREERRRLHSLEGVPDEVDEAAEEAMWVRFERERVQSALGTLPDQQREALELAYYGGFTQAELADRFGEPLGTIKSRMFTGLSRLRDVLAQEQDGARESTAPGSPSRRAREACEAHGSVAGG